MSQETRNYLSNVQRKRPSIISLGQGGTGEWPQWRLSWRWPVGVQIWTETIHNSSIHVSTNIQYRILIQQSHIVIIGPNLCVCPLQSRVSILHKTRRPCHSPRHCTICTVSLSPLLYSTSPTSNTSCQSLEFWTCTSWILNNCLWWWWYCDIVKLGSWLIWKSESSIKSQKRPRA